MKVKEAINYILFQFINVIDNDGSVSFEEFAQYLTALSLLEEQKIWGGLATTHETIPELEQTSGITPKILNN
jgi:hypothetical protein